MIRLRFINWAESSIHLKQYFYFSNHYWKLFLFFLDLLSLHFWGFEFQHAFSQSFLFHASSFLLRNGTYSRGLDLDENSADLCFIFQVSLFFLAFIWVELCRILVWNLTFALAFRVEHYGSLPFLFFQIVFNIQSKSPKTFAWSKTHLQ